MKNASFRRCVGWVLGTAATATLFGAVSSAQRPARDPVMLKRLDFLLARRRASEGKAGAS